MTTVSVLVPAHNDAEVLRECLTSVFEQTAIIDQIVVVADTCTDNTADVAREFGAEVVECNVQSKSSAQDAGLHLVTGEVMMCIDADTVIAPDVVELFLEQLETVDGTCANMLPMKQQTGFWVTNRRFAYALGRFWWRFCQGELGRLMVLSGCAYAVHTETVRALGGFPSEGVTCDMALTWEMYGAGYSTSFCDQALAYTYDPETFHVYTQQMRRWASGFFQCVSKFKGQGLKSPAAVLVVGTLLLDLCLMPLAYGIAIYFGITYGVTVLLAETYVAAMILHFIACVTIATRTITFRQAVLGWPAYWLTNFFINKPIYIWTGVRELVLGKHFTSWTGRQGRSAEVTRMTAKRKVTLIVITLVTVILLTGVVA